MSERPPNDSAGSLYAFLGVGVLFLGALLVGQSEENESFVVMGVTVGAVGLYLLIAGAVARGVQMSRAYDPERWTRHEVARTPRPADDEADVLRP